VASRQLDERLPAG